MKTSFLRESRRSTYCNLSAGDFEEHPRHLNIYPQYSIVVLPNLA